MKNYWLDFIRFKEKYPQDSVFTYVTTHVIIGNPVGTETKCKVLGHYLADDLSMGLPDKYYALIESAELGGLMVSERLLRKSNPIGDGTSFEMKRCKRL